MKIIEKTTGEFGVEKGGVLTIGNFDGVHLGHQEIFKKARQIANEKEVPCMAMTFEPHPIAFLQPQKAPGVLTPLPFKRMLMKDYGVDCLLVLKNNDELLNFTPQNFIDEFLSRQVAPTVVVEGSDFNFGKDRAGNVQTLREFGAQNGFKVVVIGPYEVELPSGHKVVASSTVIRYMLESGNVADAACVLGRYYRLAGEVIRGRGKGRELGFPTANMKNPDQIIPAEGVYAGFVRIADNIDESFKKGGEMPAVFSIGQLRTFGEEYPITIEAHILKDNVGDLAGKWMAMDFIEHIRSQHKFKSVEDLCKQIAKDCEQARKILANCRSW